VNIHELYTSPPSKKDSFTGKGIKRPTFEWNDKSTQAFKEVQSTGVLMNGWESYYNGWGFARSVMSTRGGIGTWLKPGFMEKCDLRRGTVKHIFSNMKRLRAREYNKTDETGVFEQGKIKEYITFVMRHEGKDWLGRRLVGPDITEGVYQQPTLKTEILGFSPNTGEPQIDTTLGDPIKPTYLDREMEQVEINGKKVWKITTYEPIDEKQ
jgi:hypothetical protein